MSSTIRKSILLSFKKLLAGIVRLCLRNGVTYKELTLELKALYIDICSKEYGIQGRPTNVSRIALMTGLDRKEIRRTLDKQMDSDDENTIPADRISKILTMWSRDPNYLDSQNQPLLIPFEGNAPSFQHLVKKLGGDMQAVTILRELKRSMTLLENDDGLLQLKKTYYIPNYFPQADQEPELVNPTAIEHGSSMLVDHINTIFHNLYREEKSMLERLELRATNANIPKSKVAVFHQMVDKKAMDLLYEMDNWLEENQTENKDEGTERLGLGIYFIQGENQNLRQEKDDGKK